jgi:hypothetical protein
MPRKKSSGAGLLLVFICVLVWLATKYGGALLVIGGLAVIVWLINKFHISQKKVRNPEIRKWGKSHQGYNISRALLFRF